MNPTCTALHARFPVMAVVVTVTTSGWSYPWGLQHTADAALFDGKDNARHDREIGGNDECDPLGHACDCCDPA